MSTEKEERLDGFQYWLMEMDDAIEYFMKSIPNEISIKLDYTPESLLVLEEYILHKYADIESARKKSEAKFFDGASRYLGELFRKLDGGKWYIELERKDNFFYGLPQVVGGKNQVTQLCPLALVRASTDRRKGDYLYKILMNRIK